MGTFKNIQRNSIEKNGFELTTCGQKYYISNLFGRHAWKVVQQIGRLVVTSLDQFKKKIGKILTKK